MSLNFSTVKNAEVQIFLGWHIPWWTYMILLIVVPIVINHYLDMLIVHKKLKKKVVQEWIMELSISGTFIIALALGANSGVKFGSLPSSVSFFNPMIGFIPIYIAYLLEKAILAKRIK